MQQNILYIYYIYTIYYTMISVVKGFVGLTNVLEKVFSLGPLCLLIIIVAALRG